MLVSAAPLPHSTNSTVLMAGGVFWEGASAPLNESFSSLQNQSHPVKEKKSKRKAELKVRIRSSSASDDGPSVPQTPISSAIAKYEKVIDIAGDYTGPDYDYGRLSFDGKKSPPPTLQVPDVMVAIKGTASAPASPGRGIGKQQRMRVKRTHLTTAAAAAVAPSTQTASSARQKPLDFGQSSIASCWWLVVCVQWTMLHIEDEYWDHWGFTLAWGTAATVACWLAMLPLAMHQLDPKASERGRRFTMGLILSSSILALFTSIITTVSRGPKRSRLVAIHASPKTTHPLPFTTADQLTLTRCPPTPLTTRCSTHRRTCAA